MTIKDFDYKAFAQNLAGQAAELVPQDFNENEKNYVTTTLLNYSMLAGEALYQDQENFGFSADQACMITQIIAEWAFHKSVDLIRSGIPQQYWEPIMQKIAFTIFEIARQTFKQGLPQDQILQLVEHHVKKTYLDCINELKDKNLIDEGLQQKAASQSNIDKVMQEMQQAGEINAENNIQAQMKTQTQAQTTAVSANSVQNSSAQPVPVGEKATSPVIKNKTGIKYEPPKLLKLVTVALLLKRIEDEDQVQEILECFDQTDAGTVIRYMYADDVEKAVDPTATVQMLEEIAKDLPNSAATSKKEIVERVKKIVNLYGRNNMEKKLQLERHKVRQFVFNAIEGEYYKIPPKIANIIATYLESIV